MLGILKPDFTCRSVYEIDWRDLRRRGLECALFDMDNTLAPDHGTPGLDAYGLMEELKGLGIKIAVVSNGRPGRLAEFSEKARVPCVAMARKPGPAGVLQAIEILNACRDRTVLFGDQLFTDVAAAKRAGVKACLVEKLSDKEVLQVRIKRPFEKAAIKLFDLTEDSEIL